MPRKEPKDTRPIKTLEFKLYPNQSQVQILDDWMFQARVAWNCMLAKYLNIKQAEWREKATEESGLDFSDGDEIWECHPNRWDDILWKSEKSEKKREGSCPWDKPVVFGYCCNLYIHNVKGYRREIVSRDKSFWNDVKNGFNAKSFKESRPEDKQSFPPICSRFINGVAADLNQSWKAYYDKNRPTMQKPKFKSNKKPIQTLSNANASTTVKLKGDNKIQFPLIGDIRTKGLRNRIPPGSTVVEARICRKASGWYLQLATRYDWPVPNVKMPDVAVAIDPGVRFATSTDYGRQIDAPKFLMKQAKKLRREQRKLSRRFQKGKPQGKNWLKQKAKVGRLHEKVVRQRNAFWQKESTYFVTSFGGIAIEDNNFANQGRKAKAKLREDGKGWERNNAAAKTGLNRALKDVACGKLKVMVEAKSKTIGNEVHLVKSHHNSQTCSECGHVAKENRKSQSSFNCVNCGHSMNADINAAINIHNRAAWSNRYNLHPARKQYSSESTPLSLGEVKPASASHKSSNGIEGQQEGEQSPRSEITEQSRSPGIDKKGKAKRGRKPRTLCQNLEKPIQLTLWDIA